MKILELDKVTTAILVLLVLLSMLVFLPEVDASPDRQGQALLARIPWPQLVAAISVLSVLVVMGFRKFTNVQGESSSCSADDKLNEDTLEQAKITRQHQGFHECEVSYGGEADLHKHYARCKKNPGHLNFHPIEDFKLDDLPPRYRDQLVMDWIRAKADLTCRVVVRCTSNKRPEFYPGTESSFPFYKYRGTTVNRYGSAWVCRVIMYKDGENVTCVCEECVRSALDTPKKALGEILVRTATHLIFDQTESAACECQFNYDRRDTNPSTVLTLGGLGIYKCDINGDYCSMKYVTHDRELLERFERMAERCRNLGEEVCEKYNDGKNVSPSAKGESCERNSEDCLCVIVSHPHGCSKRVTVGTWTRREVKKKDSVEYYRRDGRHNSELTQYWYNTPTCRGSSGAPVITPVGKWASVGGPKRWEGLLHAHSEGSPGNDNRSAERWETI